MNWEAMGAIGDLAGAIAVLVTLFYLSVQIRANTAQARRAAHDETMRLASSVRMALAQDSQLAALILKGAAQIEALTPVERLQFEAYVSDRFWAFVHIWDRSRSGLLEVEDWDRIRSAFPAPLLTAGALQVWDANNKQFPPGFVAEVESIRRGHRSDA